MHPRYDRARQECETTHCGAPGDSPSRAQPARLRSRESKLFRCRGIRSSCNLNDHMLETSRKTRIGRTTQAVEINLWVILCMWLEQAVLVGVRGSRRPRRQIE